MSKGNFDYQGALNEGYTDEEIMSFLGERNPKFNFKEAAEEGYSPQEINQFLSTYKPEKSTFEKGARIAGQYALGAIEGSPAGMAYNTAVLPLNTKSFAGNMELQRYGQEIEDLYEQNVGRPFEEWSDQDKEFYNYYADKLKDPQKAIEEQQPIDLSIGNIVSKVTGQDVHPEGVLEKSANWAGFIKDPKNLTEVLKTGLKPKELIKAISPTKTEVLRGLGAGSALELAEQGNFGPIGRMAATIAGDLLGHGIGQTGKGIKKLVTEPKKTLAETASKFTSKEKLDLQKDLIKDFRDSGIQADLGTLTDNNLIKFTQSRLAQSGLTGKALDDFKKQLTDQIKEQYKTLADELGVARFSTSHEAGEIAKEGIKRIRDTELASTRELYKNANASLKENSYVNPKRLSDSIEKLEKSLKPGAIKSTEQQTVLNTLDKIKRDFQDSEGRLIYADVKDLINNKIALNDIINYEVQGGSKQLLKGVVNELDRAIISHGKDNPTFAKNYIKANKDFSTHAKTFRNKSIEGLLKSEDPAQLMNRMNSIQGIRSIEKILNKSPIGSEIFDSLKRKKLDDIIEKNLVDGATQQVKLGTFSKLLEKGKNREIIKEILSPQAFKRLERLQKNAGKLAEAAEKFYNASKTGTVAVDAALIAQGISGVAHLLYGNPWPLMKITGGIMGARKLSNLLADPEFLKLAEEAILASEKGSEQDLIAVFERLSPYIMKAIQVSQKSENQEPNL